nr:ferrous iron transport protein A [Cytophagales bacterium]
MVRTAASLQRGEQSVIAHIEDSPYSINFLEIGLLPGKQIRVIQRAPFGGPIAFLVDGHMMALRISEAELIQVQPINP